MRHFLVNITDKLLLLQSLTHHYHHSVATEAKKLEQPLPKLESDLAAQFNTNVDDVGICYSVHMYSAVLHKLCHSPLVHSTFILLQTQS